MSKNVTLGEFNFDKLQAPPLTSLLTPWEIRDLEDIALSIRLSAQLRKKYELIDNILRPRGFKKFINGTNRVCYEYVEDKSFMIKAGIDAVGIKDSPWEFKNQFLFKPFIPKVFEVSPRGSVGLFERVEPITNEEEFRAVADDIYTVINEVFIGEYVLADIGTKFFMNWGIRKGFGPVLLDFPYVYKLDGKKLFCNASDPYSETGICNGPIDYDAGYNFLVCTKCGKQYKAADLRLDGESRKIIIREKGEHKMKVSISGGNKNISKTFVASEDGVFVSNVVKTTVETAPKKEVVEEKKVVEAPKVEEKKIEEPRPVEKKEEEPKVEVVQRKMAVNGVAASIKKQEDMLADAVLKEEEAPKVEEKKEDPKPVVSPISFVTEEEKMQTMSKILELINEIKSLSGLLTDDETIDLVDIFLDMATEIGNRPSDLKPELIIFNKYIEKCAMISDKFTDEDKDNIFSNNEFVKEIADLYNAWDTTEDDLPEEVEEEEDDTEEEYDTNERTGGFALVSALVKNMKDIDPEQPNKKVLVIIDQDENFILSSSREIIAVDQINNRPVDSLSIVSREWLDNVQKMINSNQVQDDIEDDDEDSIIDAVNGTTC